MLPGSSRTARSAAGEKRREYSGSAVARSEDLEGCLMDAARSTGGGVSAVKGRPAKARGAESLEKRDSKVE